MSKIEQNVREAKELLLVERSTRSVKTTEKVLKTQWKQALGQSIVEEL